MGNSKNSHKLTREEKEKAVELAIGGKDPLSYLRERGAQNPSAAWWYIKKTLAKSNPKLLEKIPEKLGTVLDEKGQAVPAKEQALPEKFEGGLTAQVTDEEAEWTALPAAGNQTAAAGGDPSTPLRSAQDDKLVINAEDLAAAEDPAVERMEQIVTMEPKPEDPRDRAKRILDDLFRFPENVTAEQNPAGRVVVDKNGVHLEPPKEPKKPDWEKTTFFGIPCEVTALKIDDFEFAKDREGMRAVLPGGTILWGSTVSTPAIMAAEQWKRLAEIIPKVMKILQIE